jgi:hypothetical protein
LEESTSDAKGACARDGLSDDNAIESAGTWAVCEEGGSFGEVRDSCDAGVLLVQLCLDDFVFGSSDGGEDVGLSCIVAVGSNTCIKLSIDVQRCWNYGVPKLIFSLKESALKASVIPANVLEKGL